MTAMNSDERLALFRRLQPGPGVFPATTGEEISIMGWAKLEKIWEMSDAELKRRVSLQWGFADDEKNDPSRVIKLPDPRVEAMLRSHVYVLYADMPMEKADEQKALNETDVLIKGRTYALATNGYVLGKYKGLGHHKCPPGTKCGCHGILWSFDQGDRGKELWEIGVYLVD